MGGWKTVGMKKDARKMEGKEEKVRERVEEHIFIELKMIKNVGRKFRKVQKDWIRVETSMS